MQGAHTQNSSQVNKDCSVPELPREPMVAKVC